MKISAVLIGKNEETMLPRVLASLKGIDEIVYCDTGSKDSSVEVAKRYTDKIFFFEWNDSFADARNAALSHATGDWILSIDCDEFLHDLKDVREAIEIAEKQGTIAIDCKMIAESTGQFFYFPRLFKRTPQIWWEGVAHNHISVNGERIGNVRITHGYSPAHQLDPDRTFRILKKAYEKQQTPRIMFYLAREYYYRHMNEECLVLLGKYVQQSRFPAEKAEAFLIMSKIYWELRMPDDARDACVQALIINPKFKEACLHMATLAGEGTGNERWEANALQWKRMAETANNEDVLFIRT